MKSIKNLIERLEQLKADAGKYHLEDEAIQTVDEVIKELQELEKTLDHLKYVEIAVRITTILAKLGGLFGDSS